MSQEVSVFDWGLRSAKLSSSRLVLELMVKSLLCLDRVEDWSAHRHRLLKIRGSELAQSGI